MTIKPYTIAARSVNVTQFDSIEEALTILPKELILHYINTCWNNTQLVKLTDAVRKNPSDYQPIYQNGR